jgi:hypothetical protein
VLAKAGRERRNMEKQWWTMREIADDLNLPIKTVYQYRRMALFESRKFGKHYRVSNEAYDIFKHNALGEVLLMMEQLP